MAEHDKAEEEQEQEQEQEQEEKRKKGNSESSHNSSDLNEGEGVTGGGFFVREQDRLLPIANVGRIMKRRLPGNAKISKEAKQTMQECVSEFISFVTGEASDRCHKEKRKTINGDDILWAMSTLGFDDYAEPLKIYLHRFRLHEADKFYSATATAATSSLAATAISAPPASASNNNNNYATSSAILLHAQNHNHNLHLHHHSFSSPSSSSSSSSPLFSSPPHRPQHHHQQR